MTNDQLAGRLLVCEAFAMVALALAVRPVLETPSPEGSIRLLDSIKTAIGQMATELSDAGAKEAGAYGDELLSRFSEYLVPKARAA
jgi:hypothetical protein